MSNLPTPSTALHSRGKTADDLFDLLDLDGARGNLALDPLAGLLAKRSDGTALPRTAEPVVAAASSGLLENLHQEFGRVVRDPTQLTGRTDWDDLRTPGFEPAPSLDELSRQAEPYPLMRDILEPRESVDRLISGFHPLARPTLLDPDAAEDVLRLFAPAQWRRAPVAVPSLTRREHHALSPDSAVHVGVSRPEVRKVVDT